MRRPTLAERVRAHFAKHPDWIPPPPLVGPNGPRPWDQGLDLGARRIEDLRKQFPRVRVERAATILRLRHETPEALVDGLEEQVYRAHYSSLKIAFSWRLAQDAVVSIGHLIGAVSAKDLEAWADFLGSAEKDKTVYASAREAVRDKVWPCEEGLWEALEYLEGQSFYGQIPLKVGLLALGSRMLLHQYACAIVDVLRRLHSNSAYTYELCLSRRPLDWREAMVFKTPPKVLSNAERRSLEHKRSQPDWRAMRREAIRRGLDPTTDLTDLVADLANSTPPKAP